MFNKISLIEEWRNLIVQKSLKQRNYNSKEKDQVILEEKFFRGQDFQQLKRLFKLHFDCDSTSVSGSGSKDFQK